MLDGIREQVAQRLRQAARIRIDLAGGRVPVHEDAPAPPGGGGAPGLARALNDREGVERSRLRAGPASARGRGDVIGCGVHAAQLEQKRVRGSPRAEPCPEGVEAQ